MQPPLGFKRDVFRSLIPWALVASAFAIAAALGGADEASGQDSLVAMNPFPIVRIVGEIRSSGAKVTRLSAKGPTAARLVTRCTPASKCPYEQRAQLIPGPEGSSRTVRIRALERRYRAGATLRVFVAAPGFIGKYTSFRIRRGKGPKRYDRCLRGLELTPIECPAS
jgi:hypothetical protein